MPLTFCSLIADGRGIGSVSLGGMQGRRHGALSVLEFPPRAVLLAQGAGWKLMVIPGLAATVALAVHETLTLTARRCLQAPVSWGEAGWTGPPRLLGVAILARPLWAEQPSHGQHALNGFFCAWWGRTFSADVDTDDDNYLLSLPDCNDGHKYWFPQISADNL